MTVSDTKKSDTSSVIDEVKQDFALLEKAVTNIDSRFTLKVLRGLPALRNKLNETLLNEIIELVFPRLHPSRDTFALVLPVDVAVGDETKDTASSTSEGLLPEIDVFTHLMVLVWIFHQDIAHPQIDKFASCCVRLVQKYSRRSLDYLGAKIWFYYAQIREINGESEQVRPELLAALRVVSLRHDTETQAMLIVILLRNYLQCSKVSQAANLVVKTTFPETASNALTARYNYYLAKIYAIQLDYSGAFDRITAAIRKAPHSSKAAGFLQAAHKLSVVVELLMGDIPERMVFQQPALEKSLAPYYFVACAVRAGDIAEFNETVKKYASRFRKDGLYTLVRRLGQNVIKTGIRMMSLSYSKISLKDICLKLHLDNEESAEYIVAKAIRDGVIDATINPERGYMQSKEVVDVYSTTYPQSAFNDRIKFCISLHDDSVKSMRFFNNMNQAELKSAEEASKRENELVNEIQQGPERDEDADFDV